jgi:NAD(P)H-flavin reductase
MLLLPGIGEAAISISSDPADTTVIEHTVHALGNVTLALARLGVGDEIILRGPFGRGWPLDELRGRDIVIAAGGLGLASLRAAVLQLARDRAAYGRIVLLHGSRTPAMLLYGRDYDAWRAAGIEVLTIVDHAAPGWGGPTGFVPSLLTGLSVEPARTSLLCCGPEPMMKAVVATATDRGIATRDILLSVERNMACAAGFCGLCQFGPTFVCKDGPVFRYPTIAPYLAVAQL